MPSVAEFIKSQPPAPETLLLPRDQVFYMEGRLFAQIGSIRDPEVLPYLNEFSKSTNQYLRMYAVDAIRAMGSSQGSQTLITELNDPNVDTAFSAMQGLIELSGGGDWVPTFEQFRHAPSFYAAKCREWWESEGQQRAAVRSLGPKVN